MQAGLEAYNRHATEEMDSLLEVQRNLMARERQLQGLVSVEPRQQRKLYGRIEAVRQCSSCALFCCALVFKMWGNAQAVP